MKDGFFGFCETESALPETESQSGSQLRTMETVTNHAKRATNNTVSDSENVNQTVLNELAPLAPTSGCLGTVFTGQVCRKAQLGPCGAETWGRLDPEAESKDPVCARPPE